MAKKLSGYLRHLNKRVPALVWHYTTLQGMQGIVQDQAIWATDARYLNDSREYVHATELFKKMIEGKKEGADEIELTILRQVTDLMENVHSLKSHQVFVSSFSTSEDQLSQWRAYGSTARGVSVGLDLRRLEIPEKKISASILAPCIYSKVEQIRLFENWLAGYRKVFKEMTTKTSNVAVALIPLIEEGAGSAQKLLDRFGVDLMMRMFRLLLDLGTLCALMKDEAFVEEKEWRLVVIESRDRLIPSPYPKLSRIGATTLVPYISFPIGIGSSEAKRSRVKRIKVGPHPEPERAADSIRDFLIANALLGVIVGSSRIPFRTW